MSLGAGPDLEQARRFLQLLHPGGEFCFQCIDDQKPARFPSDIRHADTIVGMVLQQHAKGAGVFVAVNETNNRGRHVDEIVRVRAVWLEDDDGYKGTLPIEPSIVVATSPGHRHVYWLVADAWPADEQGRRDFDGIMARMVGDYGSDPGAKDISRVLRVPGFLHRKNPTAPHLVHIVEASGARYTRAELLAAFPSLERSSAATTGTALPADAERVRDALAHVPADDRQVWLSIGMALKHEFGEAGRMLWDEWSAICAE